MDFEFKNIAREILPFLENIIDENRCTITRREWKNKYNAYVVYDHEPFCADGFENNILVKGEAQHVNYVRYLYLTNLANIEHLQRCINVVYKPSLLEKIGIGKR